MFRFLTYTLLASMEVVSNRSSSTCLITVTSSPSTSLNASALWSQSSISTVTYPSSAYFSENVWGVTAFTVPFMVIHVSSACI